MSTLLEVKDLEIGYGGESVVKNINFTLKKGEILGIVGESGSGKSTLLKGILDIPGAGIAINKGAVFYHGNEISKLSNKEKRALRGAKIGSIFQNPTASLNPIKKIKYQFVETLRSHENMSKKVAYLRSLEMLEKLNFIDPVGILERYPFELSGGMNQRVAIALAMVLNPDIILADEPTSALDVTIQAQVIEELLFLRDKFQTAIVIITHNMGVVSKIADKIAVMYDGEIVEYGKKEHVLKNHQHAYTSALLKAIPRLEGKKVL